MTRAQLREWRKRQGITQQHLANLLSVHPVTIARWETGTRKIPSFLHLALKSLERPKRKGGEKHGKAEKKRK